MTDRTGTTILIIDDDADVRVSTAKMLTGAGFAVVSGNSAGEALTLTRRLKPAMLLLDVNMPDGNGIDVARQLKSEPGLASVFIVMASGSRTSPEHQAEGLDRGLADGYIVRPVNKTEFLARIDAFLRLRDTQEALRTALREKEALIQEVHHRVKNNLTLITSLLRLEARNIKDVTAQAVLQDMGHRIQSLALLHELLYRSNSVTRVDLGAHVAQLVDHLFASLVGGRAGVTLRTELSPVFVNTRQAIACGLLVNELVTNCVKHGFPNGQGGEVRVGLQQADGSPTVLLTVADTGVGLPSNFAARRTESLGMQLVSDLTRQLKGQLEIGQGPGASFAVRFHADPHDARASEGRP